MLSMKLPHTVSITEVGPRDGLQSVATRISTEDKVALVDAISESGVGSIEVASFVSPKAVPQHADAGEVMARIKRKAGVVYRVLVPNLKGAQLAVESGADGVVFLLSASESHNRLNVRRSVSDSLAEFASVADCARRGGIKGVSVTIATAFGCPFEGSIPPQRIVELAVRVRESGAAGVILADTTGMANPVGVARLLDVLAQHVPVGRISVHFHNTRGTGLANVLSALEFGITTLEGSVGGLGGCPFAPGANGNVATEDMVGMLEEMGVHSGVDLLALIGCARLAGRIVGQDLPGQLLKAGRVCDLHSIPSTAGT
jgi:hydroxymethylglutaryl-CoA lyase